MKKRSRRQFSLGIEFHIDVFDFHVYIINDKEVATEIFNNMLNGTEVFPEYKGFCAQNSQEILIYISDSWDKNNFLSVFAHETSPAADYILNTIRSECGEVRGYLIQHIFWEAKDWINERLKILNGRKNE